MAGSAVGEGRALYDALGRLQALGFVAGCCCSGSYTRLLLLLLLYSGTLGLL